MIILIRKIYWLMTDTPCSLYISFASYSHQHQIILESGNSQRQVAVSWGEQRHVTLSRAARVVAIHAAPASFSVFFPRLLFGSPSVL